MLSRPWFGIVTLINGVIGIAVLLTPPATFDNPGGRTLTAILALALAVICGWFFVSLGDENSAGAKMIARERARSYRGSPRWLYWTALLAAITGVMLVIGAVMSGPANPGHWFAPVNVFALALTYALGARAGASQRVK